MLASIKRKTNPFRQPAMRILLLLAAVIAPALAHSEPIEFEIIGAMNGSTCSPNLAEEDTLLGLMVWDPDTIQRQTGGDYFPAFNTASISLSASDGFDLTLNSAVIGVQPSSPQDTFYNQSFISEDPNGWNIVIDVIVEGGTTGWLQGDNTLPTQFPDDLEQSFISAYFLDEFNMIEVYDARLCSIRPPQPQGPGSSSSPAVPVPVAGGAGYAFFALLLIGFAWRYVQSGK